MQIATHRTHNLFHSDTEAISRPVSDVHREEADRFNTLSAEEVHGIRWYIGRHNATLVSYQGILQSFLLRQI